jgi:hypothetical protein
MTSDTTLIIASVPGRGELLERALESAEAQILPFDTILVRVDSHREGAAATRNHLLRIVRTRFTAVLDDDDFLLPHHNLTLKGLLDEHPEAGLAYSSGQFLRRQVPDLADPNFGHFAPFNWEVTVGDSQVPAHRVPFWVVSGQLRLFNWIPVTTMFRTEDALRAGGYNTIYDDAEDWSFLLCLRDDGVEFVNTSEVTWVYDITRKRKV